MKLIEFELTLAGTSSLIMHSARLSNPLDPATKALKEITSKRIKTDDDHMEAAKREFMGGIYHDPEIGPYVPGENIHRCLQEAAKKTRAGKKVEEGLFIASDVNPLAYDGPREKIDLWEAEYYRMDSVKVTTSRVMRTRPEFKKWATSAIGQLDTSILSLEELTEIAFTAGNRIGLCDWRPRHGRFVSSVEVIREIKA